MDIGGDTEDNEIEVKWSLGIESSIKSIEGITPIYKEDVKDIFFNRLTPWSKLSIGCLYGSHVVVKNNRHRLHESKTLFPKDGNFIVHGNMAAVKTTNGLVQRFRYCL